MTLALMKEAIPTEYAGIRFRSKSEAIFARGLDLSYQKVVWEYEPAEFKVGDWVPDFYLVGETRHHLWHRVIEFKPNKPTDSYKESLARKCARFENDPRNLSMLLITGSPFDSGIPRTVEILDSSGWVECDMKEFYWRNWEEAKGYRFDLATNGNDTRYPSTSY